MKYANVQSVMPKAYVYLRHVDIFLVGIYFLKTKTILKNVCLSFLFLLNEVTAFRSLSPL